MSAWEGQDAEAARDEIERLKSEVARLRAALHFADDRIASKCGKRMSRDELADLRRLVRGAIGL